MTMTMKIIILLPIKMKKKKKIPWDRRKNILLSKIIKIFYNFESIFKKLAKLKVQFYLGCD